MNTLVVPRGDTPTFRFTFTTSDGTPLVAGVIAIFVIKHLNGQELVRIEKSVSEEGYADFRISRSVSDLLHIRYPGALGWGEECEYRWGISLRYGSTSDSAVATVDYQTPEGWGEFVVSQNVVRGRTTTTGQLASINAAAATFAATGEAATSELEPTNESGVTGTISFTVNAYQSAGGGGVSSYNDLTDLPSIESVQLVGNQTAASLGLALSSDLETVEDSIDDLTGRVTTVETDVEGIPATVSAVQANVDALSSDVEDNYLPRLENQDATKNPNAIYLNWATIAGNAVGVQIVAMGYSTLSRSFIQTSVSVPVASASEAGIVLPALVNQVQQNRNDIENILQTGSTPLDLPTRAALASYPATASGVKVGQDTTVLADEGASGSLTKWVYDPDYDQSLYPNAVIVNGFRFRFIGQEVPYVIATASTAGLVVSVETSVPGQIKVEEDGTMSVWGWDAVTDAVSDLQTAVASVDSNFTTFANSQIPFNLTHNHNGTTGNGPKIAYSDLTGIPPNFAGTQAGGDLVGTYPNPTLRNDVITSVVVGTSATPALGTSFNMPRVGVNSKGLTTTLAAVQITLPTAAAVAAAVIPHAVSESAAQTQSAANPNIYVSFDIVE